MRDIVFTLILIPAVLAIFGSPWFGIVVLTWLGYMNPHRLCYGYAVLFPFFEITILVTVASILISREAKWLAWSREMWLLLIFILWTNVTFLFALNPEGAYHEWDRWMKIHVFLALNLLVMKDRFRIHWLIWAIVVSFGFFGIKGGIFTLLTGGHHRVEGPQWSFIEDNNHLAVALNMSLPLMRYLQLQTERRVVRIGLGIAMALTMLSIIASYSRAGFLALGAVLLLLWWKSRRKVLFGTGLAATAIAILMFMPGEWTQRMNTIKTYHADGSAQGRLNAWHFAVRLAQDRPIVGGGFRTFTKSLFRVYAPDPEDHHDAHSIYFQILAEQGFPGLMIFLLLAVCTWRTAGRIRRIGKESPNTQWATDLMSMVQVSIAAFAFGGAFVGMGYFDLPYHLAVIVTLTKTAVLRQQAEAPEEMAEAVAAGPQEVPAIA